MKEMLIDSVYFGATISIIGYALGNIIKKRYQISFLNPLLISIVFVISFLLVFKIEYASYEQGARYISYLLTPATVCLAIPLYEQLDLLKKNLKAVIIGISSGVFASFGSILSFSMVFQFTHEQYVTLLPKSITAAMGIGLSQELGGSPTITVAAIIMTGVFGNIFAESICKILGINQPVAVGLAVGTAAHAMGTARALEIGEAEGAMSSLSVAVAGILTVIFASFFAGFL